MPSSSTPLRQPVLPPDEDAIEDGEDLRLLIAEGLAEADRGEFLEQDQVETFFKEWIAGSEKQAAQRR